MNLGYVLCTKPEVAHVDVSQSIGRAYTSDKNDELPCLTGSHKVMMLKHGNGNRRLLGYEAMLVDGASRAWLEERLLCDFSYPRF